MSAQRSTQEEKKPTTMTSKLRKWHFLLLGGSLILLSIYLWYWNWRALGVPDRFHPEYLATLLSFLVGLFVLGLFVVRLTKRQVTIMVVGMVVVNLLAALGTLWIFRSYPAFFGLINPGGTGVYDTTTIQAWRSFFLPPALTLIHAGLLLIWAESLLMFFIRNPGDKPE